VLVKHLTSDPFINRKVGNISCLIPYVPASFETQIPII
jgi:hypothetical protein